MQPEQPIPPAGGENPYDFILAGPPKPKKKLIPGGDGSFKQRIILVIGAAFGLMLILYVIFGLILGGSGSTGLVNIAQQQSEIIRISTAGSTQVRDAPTANFTQNVLLTTTSAQQQTISFLDKNGKKLKEKDLGLLKSSKTDQDLATAEQNGKYDSALLEVLVAQLKDYQASLSDNFKSSGSQKQKVLVESFYKQVTDLLANQPPAANL